LDGDFLTLKSLIESNTLGRVVDYESHFDRYRNYLKNNWKEQDFSGNGIVYDLASHLIDQGKIEKKNFFFLNRLIKKNKKNKKVL